MSWRYQGRYQLRSSRLPDILLHYNN